MSGAEDVDGSGRWQILAIVREAQRNLFPPRGPLAATLFVSVVVGLALGGLVAQRASAFGDEAHRNESTWSPVVLIGPADPTNAAATRISRRSCDELADRGAASGVTVLRSGLLVDEPSDEIVQLGPLTPVVAVSGSLLGDDPVGIGVELARSAAPRSLRGRRLGVVIAKPLARQPDRLGLNSAVVVSLDPARRDGAVCAAVLAPFVSPASVAPALLGRVSVSGSPVAARFDAPGDERERYLGRLERFLPVGVGAALTLLALVVLAGRRGHLATYLLCGSDRSDVLAMLAVEQFLVSGATALGVCAGALAFGAPTAIYASVLLAGLVAPALPAALVPLGALALLATNPLTFAKES